MKKFISDVSNIPIIGEDNFDSILDPTQSTGLIPRDYDKEPFGSNGFAVPLQIKNIPRDEWRERIKDLERSKSLLSIIARKAGVKTKYQASTNYCWANGPALATEIVIVKQGGEYTELSPASVAGPITGYRNVGGWGTKAVAKIVSDGISPVKFWPANAIDRRYDNAQSRAARQAFKLTEWADVEPRNFDALMTCLLLGLPVPVAYMRIAHLMCAIDPVALDDGFGVKIWNSHGDRFGDQGMVVFREGPGTPDEAIAPMVSLAV